MKDIPKSTMATGGNQKAFLLVALLSYITLPSHVTIAHISCSSGPIAGSVGRCSEGVDYPGTMGLSAYELDTVVTQGDSNSQKMEHDFTTEPFTRTGTTIAAMYIQSMGSDPNPIATESGKSVARWYLITECCDTSLFKGISQKASLLVVLPAQHQGQHWHLRHLQCLNCHKRHVNCRQHLVDRCQRPVDCHQRLEQEQLKLESLLFTKPHQHLRPREHGPGLREHCPGPRERPQEHCP